MSSAARQQCPRGLPLWWRVLSGVFSGVFSAEIRSMIDRGERRSEAWRGLATNTQRCSTPSRSRFSSSRARPALCVRVVTGRLQGLRQHHHLQRHQHAWGATLRVGTGKGFALRPSKAGGDPGRVGAQPIPALHLGEFALPSGDFALAGRSPRVSLLLDKLLSPKSLLSDSHPSVSKPSSVCYQGLITLEEGTAVTGFVLSCVHR